MTGKFSTMTLLFAGLLVCTAAADAQVSVDVIHRFAGGSDGARPNAALIQGTDGNFYGTTGYGGSACQPLGCGTVFQMTTEGTIRILHAFTGGPDGANPAGPLVQAADGYFYGTTFGGGDTSRCFGNGCGTVFRMTPAGTLTTLHVFTGGPEDGGIPTGLLEATDGTFYGMTTRGGDLTCGAPNGCGTVFQMAPDGRITVLHAFAGDTDGAVPSEALIEATDENFYGTTSFGGAGCTAPSQWGGCGTVFRMTPDGAVTILYAFTGGFDGKNPHAALLEADDPGQAAVGGGRKRRCRPRDDCTPSSQPGSLWGTTQFGGVPCFRDIGCGTVFQLTPDGTFTTVHLFSAAGGGAHPVAPLIQASDGNIYGTAPTSPFRDQFGAIFQIAPTGAVSTVHVFNVNGSEGTFPNALLEVSDGLFYGTTAGYSFRCESPGLCGTVFRMTVP